MRKRTLLGASIGMHPRTYARHSCHLHGCITEIGEEHLCCIKETQRLHPGGGTTVVGANWHYDSNDNIAWMLCNRRTSFSSSHASTHISRDRPRSLVR
jgi:hypothetical protein